jgi:hypothetical protein
MEAEFAVKDTWCIKAVGSNSLLELRALYPAPNKDKKWPIIKRFRGSDFDSVKELKEAFEAEALRLNSEGYNIYTPLNPIKSDTDIPNGKSCKDVNIEYRDVFFLDLDRIGGTEQPANDEELEQAEQVADAVSAYLKAEGLVDPIKVMSGNGYHLYYVLDNVPNTVEATESIQALLKVLGAKFDTDTIKIDQSVYNASRITKVLGCIARKGIESEGRHYRMARLC